MADWRHIQGKIRKARTSSDPPAQLAALYESTRDAMVAFELARLYEKTGSTPEAIQWYLTAAEKFRRAQWKTKAQEALTRLGVEVPLAESEAASEAAGGSVSNETVAPNSSDGPVSGNLFAREASPSELMEAIGEPDSDAEAGMSAPGESEGAGVVAASGGMEGAAAGDPAKKRRRRGRRGGRGRRKKLPGAAEAGPAVVSPISESRPAPRNIQSVSSRPAARTPSPSRRTPSSSEQPTEFRRRTPGQPLERTPDRGSGRSSERSPDQEAEARESAGMVGAVGPAAWQGRRRAGEPALASRLALLESQLRRMLASPPATLDDAERAPAGPGVFVLSDSEMIDHYYVEACQTLRIGIGNLVRSGRNRGGENIRTRLADHLGITEARVAKYMKDHCAIRWVQLDEDAPLLAHFAVAVLRPALNNE